MPTLRHEKRLLRTGLRFVAGIDEAGRGPLAGPVFAAAVILPARFPCPGLDDSKKIPPLRREQLFDKITTHKAVRWSVAHATVTEIDTLNILRATHLAMRRAAEALLPTPCHCLIDGLPVRDFPFPHDAIVRGDSLSLSIAAASIVAKVSRDRHMRQLHAEFPAFGFASHFGYGTKQHLDALRIHGICVHHRRSFQPVSQLALPLDGF
ncbi:MAG: ribonuclease HII [Verrucomicrobiota bacterium]